jgi:hypothetical protein
MPGKELDFEVFIAVIILDRISQIRFHKVVMATELKKSPTHTAMHALRYHHC